MQKLNCTHVCVNEAIDEVGALNPTFKEIIIAPRSFVTFLRCLGKNTLIFCKWNKNKTKLTYNTGAVKINIKVDKTLAQPVTFFFGPKNECIEVELSG